MKATSEAGVAEDHLRRFGSGPLGHFIGGEFVAGHSGETLDNLNPVNNRTIGRVAVASAEDVDRACSCAQDAFPAWSGASGQERRAVLHRLADVIEARAEEIALVESTDTGQPIRYMRQAAARGAANFRYFADKAQEAADGQALYQTHHTNITMRSAIGPVAVITPWNTPFMLSTWKIAPALAAGCTVVHKPAEQTPLTATLLAQASIEAGLAPGVWNMVNGTGEITGKALTEHPAIRAVAFVGESATGARIQAQGAATLKRVHFELGGKNPVIVFDDADLERALDAVVFMIYSLNGQRCTSSSRLLIQRSVQDAFVSRLAERVGRIRVGHPLDPDTELGPLVSRGHLAKVLGYCALAADEGAELRVGGTRRADLGEGNFMAPALITGATNRMRVAREEIFGPVLTAIPFDTEEEAVALANDSEYGLSAYLWTRDVERSMRMARALETGMLWVNSENNRNLPSPFGGIKRSGIGRDGGDYSFDFFMETKNVCLAHGTHAVPRLGVA